jgi:hypothetical protein
VTVFDEPIGASDLGRTQAIVSRVVDEESIGHCRKKIGEYSLHNKTEEEVEEILKDLLNGQFNDQVDAPAVDELRAGIIESARGDPGEVASLNRRIRWLQASKSSSTVTVRGKELRWKEAIRLFRGMPEQELMSFVHSYGDGVEDVLARLALQGRRPDLSRVESGQLWLALGDTCRPWIDEEARQGIGRAENEEIGRKTELKATEFLQGKLRDRADVIRRGGQGQPDLEVIFRAPKRPREFVAVKSTKELRTKRPSVTYSNLDRCPEAIEARRHGRPLFFLLVEDRNTGRWCMRPVPVGIERMKMVAADFGRFELPRAFGR